jgi:hypothetical protein
MTEDQQAPQKKSTSPWVWVAAGCGGLTILAVLAGVAVVGFGWFKARDFIGDVQENPARAIAELAIQRDPDLEIVDSDESEGTFTFRNLRTGEVATLDFEDIAEGRFTVTTEEGEVTMEATPSEEGGGLTVSGPEGEARFGADASLENVPEWVPVLPDADQTSGTFQTTTAEGTAGVVAQVTELSVREVLDWFEEWFEREGYTSAGETSTSTPQGSMGGVTGTSADGGRTINVAAVETEEGTQVTVNYNEGGA